MTDAGVVHGAAMAPDEGSTDDGRDREPVGEHRGPADVAHRGGAVGFAGVGVDRVERCAPTRRGAAEPERGDVPGWVLVTLMTAGLVTALWVIAGDALGTVFEDAINSVKAP